MNQRGAMIVAEVCAELCEIGGQVFPPVHARRLGWFPDTRAKRPTKTGDADAVDLDHAPVQCAGRGARIARGVGHVFPHLLAAIIVVVAEYPEHRDATIQQRRDVIIQRARALQIAKQDHCLRRYRTCRQPLFDALPLSMHITNERDRHIMPAGRCP